MKTDEPLWARIRGPLAFSGIGALAVTAAVAAVGLPTTSTGVRPLNSAEIRALATPTPTPTQAPTVHTYRGPTNEPTPELHKKYGPAITLYTTPAIVVGSCTMDGRLSRIENWSPAPGYKGTQITKSPAQISVLRFTGPPGFAPTEVRVTCRDGQPDLTVVQTGPGKPR